MDFRESCLLFVFQNSRAPGNILLQRSDCESSRLPHHCFMRCLALRCTSSSGTADPHVESSRQVPSPAMAYIPNNKFPALSGALQTIFLTQLLGERNRMRGLCGRALSHFATKEPTHCVCVALVRRYVYGRERRETLARAGQAKAGRCRLFQITVAKKGKDKGSHGADDS